MSDTARNSDQEIKSGLTAIKDDSGDSGITVTDPDTGWHAERMVEYVTTSPNGARHIKRDKEYSFRPYFAKAVHDAVNYRDFREPPGSPVGTPSGNTVALDDNTLLVGVQPGAGSLAADWVVKAEDVGFEFSVVSDTLNFLKSKPDFNPFHPNGRNQSSLFISKDEPIAADKDVDLPRRYFGRAHDMIVPRQTQDVKLKRVRFVPKGNYFNKKTKTTEDYQDAFYKAMWNISPFEQPFEGLLKQQSEHIGDMKGGRHGFTAHDYATAIDSELILLVPPVFQGGWMVDLVLDVAGQIHDVLGIGRGTRYERYEARDGKKVNLVYMRHDAMFAKFPTQKGRFHFLGFEDAIEPVGEPFWADHVMDDDKKGLDTKLDEPPPRTKHEDGQWRVRFRMEPPRGRPPWCPPYGDWTVTGESGQPHPTTHGGPENGPPFEDPPRFPFWYHRFQEQQFEAVTAHHTVDRFAYAWAIDDIAYKIRIPIMVAADISPNRVDVQVAFRSRPDCPLSAPPPLVELPVRSLSAFEINEKGFCLIDFEIGAGHVKDHPDGTLEFGVFQRSSSTATEPMLMGMGIIDKIVPGNSLTKAPPDSPINLDQMDSGGSIAPGGSTSDLIITFEADLTDPDLEAIRLEVEVVLTSASFESTPTRRAIAVASGGTGTVAILLSSGTYKWRARGLNASGEVSDWVAFADPSFTIV